MISLSTRHSPNLFIYPRKKTMVDTGNVRITIQSFLCHIREVIKYTMTAPSWVHIPIRQDAVPHSASSRYRVNT